MTASRSGRWNRNRPAGSTTVATASLAIQWQTWRNPKVAAEPCPDVNLIQPSPIAVPNPSEKRRIVASPDLQIVLGDRLEASLTTSDDTRSRLHDALGADTLTPRQRNLSAAELPRRLLDTH